MDCRCECGMVGSFQHLFTNCFDLPEFQEINSLINRGIFQVKDFLQNHQQFGHSLIYQLIDAILDSNIQSWF